MYKRTSETAYGQTFNPALLRRCWKECLEKSSFSARKQAAEEFNKNNYWKKRGLAVVPMKFTIGIPLTYYNQVRLRRCLLTTSSFPHDCLKKAIMYNKGWSPQGGKEMGPFPPAGNKVDLGKRVDCGCQSRPGVTQSQGLQKQSTVQLLELGFRLGLECED